MYESMSLEAFMLALTGYSDSFLKDYSSLRDQKSFCNNIGQQQMFLDG
jgi:hypothetical protein